MKGFFTTETSNLFWYCKPRGGNQYTITEYIKYGKDKGQTISLPTRRTIPKERMEHWIQYRR